MENKELRILAVDDIYDNLITLKALILEAFSQAQVVFALSGNEALSIAERIEPDIIMLDVVMPEMDGFEVCKALKANPKLTDIPVIFITALKGDKESRIKGLEVGAEAFLAKPVDESELVAQIKAMSKIRQANLARRMEQEQLSEIVSEKTKQLELNNAATLNLLEDLQKEITARRNTEAELMRSEARLRRAELASKSGNWEYDPETTMFNLSEGAVFLLGFPENYVAYSDFLDLFEPDSGRVFELSLQQLLDKNLPFNTELRLTPKGNPAAIDVRIFAVKEKQDKLVFGILRNVTEQKEARQKLVESEQKFRELMDNSPEGITIYVDGIIAYVNKEAMNVMRAKEPGELIGRSLFDFIHPDNVDIIMQRMHFVAMTPLNVALPAVEEKYIRLDGSEVEVEIKVMPILYEGKPAVQISGHDITEKKQAREEIEKNRKELKTIYDNAPVMMCVVNEKSEILFANNALDTFIDNPNKLTANITACGNVFGCINSLDKPEGCGHGANCSSCVLRHALIDTFKTGIEHKDIDYQTTILRGKKQKKVALLASTSLIQTEGEKRLLLCMHDITVRREAQEALLDYQIQLKEFAAHLQTVREEERVDLAREIHDDLGQVLVAIKFDLGMLGVKSKKYIREEAVEEFTKQFKRLEGYVNNSIKSARRIMTDLRPELLDMVGLVEAFKEHINAFNDRQLIACEFINKTSGVALAPEKSVALFRILQESLNNASKYSEATKITVELGSKDNATYLIITDNGVGFDLAIKKRSDSYGLTGMKERAFLLDGTVDIWSEPGKGVQIKVFVPE